MNELIRALADGPLKGKIVSKPPVFHYAETAIEVTLDGEDRWLLVGVIFDTVEKEWMTEDRFAFETALYYAIGDEIGIPWLTKINPRTVAEVCLTVWKENHD